MSVMTVNRPDETTILTWVTGEDAPDVSFAFNEARARNTLLYRRTEAGDYEQITEFDKDAPEIYGVPQIAGG